MHRALLRNLKIHFPSFFSTINYCGIIFHLQTEKGECAGRISTCLGSDRLDITTVIARKP